MTAAGLRPEGKRGSGQAVLRPRDTTLAAALPTPASPPLHTPRPHRPAVADAAEEDETMETVMIAYATAAAAPGLFRAPFAALRGWWRERRVAAALHALDDATLKDIGLYRCEIPSVARARRAEPRGL